MTHAPNDYALVIGIDHYPKWAGGRKSLKGSVNDATDFRAWLVDPNGGGLNPDNARLVVSTENPVAPLQQVIDEEFKVIRENSRDRPRRRFYFYFSGHGHTQAQSDQQALCLANWSVQDQGAALQLESYRNASVGCLNFEEGLFFLDCCRVRETTPSGKTSDLECGDPKFEGKHHIVFYATEHYNAGYEDSANDDARGYFTRALMKILRAGTIEAFELEKRLGKDVADLAMPRKQIARAVRAAGREIYLGPPTNPPQPDALAGEPPGNSAHLSVSLETRLRTQTTIEEPPAPAPGDVSVHQGERIVGSGRGRFDGDLPLGTYRVRIAHGEAVESHSIDLRADADLTFPLPRRVSAAPLSSTVDKQEIVTDPIVTASKQRRDDAGQAIFIAHRTRHGAEDGRFAGKLAIEGPWPEMSAGVITDGRTLLPAIPGVYELSYSDPNGSTFHLSVPVATGWDTQVFIVEDEGRAILERASIFMQPAGRGFDPADGLINAYELALSDLVTGGPGPDATTLDLLLEGKFRNPLFGLVGAHFLVRELQRAKERVESRHHLLDVVIENLTRLLGDSSPDVIALVLLRGQLNGEAVQRDLSVGRPLLQASFQALIEATAGRPTLFRNAFDSVALGLLRGSPWTCWREQPSASSVYAFMDYRKGVTRHYVKMKPSNRLNLLERILVSEDFRLFKGVVGEMHHIEAEGALNHAIDFDSITRLATVPDWVVDFIRAEVEQSSRTEQPLNLGKLVRRLGLPRGLLEQAERIVRSESLPSHTTSTDGQKATAIEGAN